MIKDVIMSITQCDKRCKIEYKSNTNDMIIKIHMCLFFTNVSISKSSPDRDTELNNYQAFNVDEKCAIKDSLLSRRMRFNSIILSKRSISYELFSNVF